MTWNPLDWPAQPFLLLYVALALIIFGLSYNLRTTIGPAAQTPCQLGVLELAYLAGGVRRLADAVMLCLTSGGGATITSGDCKITVTDQTPLEVLMGRPSRLSLSSDMEPQQFLVAIKPLTEQIRARLREFGYCPTNDQIMTFRMTFLPFIGLLAVFGGVKAVLGAERQHSVGILIALLIITVVGAIFLAKAPIQTRAGNEVLQTYQQSNARAARAPLDHELLLSVALSGAVVLSGTAYASVYAASRSMQSSSGDGGGGSSCGGGGGGCGGCS